MQLYMFILHFQPNSNLTIDIISLAFSQLKSHCILMKRLSFTPITIGCFQRTRRRFFQSMTSWIVWTNTISKSRTNGIITSPKSKWWDPHIIHKLDVGEYPSHIVLILPTPWWTLDTAKAESLHPTGPRGIDQLGLSEVNSQSFCWRHVVKWPLCSLVKHGKTMNSISIPYQFPFSVDSSPEFCCFFPCFPLQKSDPFRIQVASARKWVRIPPARRRRPFSVVVFP